MQAKLRALDKRRTAAAGGGEESDDDDDDDAEDAGGASKKRRTGPSFLEQELAKYAAGRKGKRKGGKRDEDDVMAALSSFTGKLKRRADEDDDVDEQRGGGADGSLGKRTDVGLYLDDREDVEGIEVDDDVDFLKHALRAETEPDMSESRRAESDYTVSWATPRQQMSSRSHADHARSGHRSKSKGKSTARRAQGRRRSGQRESLGQLEAVGYDVTTLAKCALDAYGATHGHQRRVKRGGLQIESRIERQ